MFITASSTITKMWKKPRCPSKDELIKDMQYLYMVKYYSDIKENG